MKPFFISLALLCALSTPISADPNPQLVQSVQNRLAFYGFHVDVSEFATNTVARLHLTLSARGDYISKKRELRQILRNPTFK